MSKKKVYWTTKSGKRIDIDKMDIDHLRNTLKMIVRKTQNHKEDIDTSPYAFDHYWNW